MEVVAHDQRWNIRYNLTVLALRWLQFFGQAGRSDTRMELWEQSYLPSSANLDLYNSQRPHSSQHCMETVSNGGRQQRLQYYVTRPVTDDDGMMIVEVGTERTAA